MKTIFVTIYCISMTLMSFGQTKSFYDLTARDIDGKEVKLSTYKGKKLLIVNVASECGNTPQYDTLQHLYQKFGGEHFSIIGFPANNFGEQEPGADAEIKQFCSSTYHVTFPMMSKISVKGANMDPVYQWLTKKSENGVMDSKVTWNFQKYMIDEQGKLVGVVDPDTSPDCPQIMSWLMSR